MEEYLPLIFVAAAIAINLFKGKKQEEDEEQTPQMPPFPPVFPAGKPGNTQPRQTHTPAMETKTVVSHPQPIATHRKKAEQPHAKKIKPAFQEKSMPVHAIPHASTPSSKTKGIKKTIPTPLPPVEETGSSISLSTPEEARRAFLSAEIFQRKY